MQEFGGKRPMRPMAETQVYGDATQVPVYYWTVRVLSFDGGSVIRRGAAVQRPLTRNNKEGRHGEVLDGPR